MKSVLITYKLGEVEGSDLLATKEMENIQNFDVSGHFATFQTIEDDNFMVRADAIISIDFEAGQETIH